MARIIHCCGRHLQTKGWHEIMWGTPPHHPGQLPIMVRVALTRLREQPDVPIVLSFGGGDSGAHSQESAEAPLDFLVTHLPDLEEFDIFRQQKAEERFRGFLTGVSVQFFRYARGISFRTDTESCSASQELLALGWHAARFMFRLDEILVVACPSDLPACVRDLFASWMKDPNTERLLPLVRFVGSSSLDPNVGEDALQEQGPKP